MIKFRRTDSSTTAPHTYTTAPPTYTTALPPDTTAPPTHTTAPHTYTTAPPSDTTAPLPDTTAPPTYTTTPPDTTAPESSRPAVDGDVRLVKTRSCCSGRVEIFYQGRWGSVCYSGWDVNDANVVCRQLGFDRAQYAVYFPAAVGDPIWLSSASCRGSERSITDCGTLGYYSCSRNAVAGAINPHVLSPLPRSACCSNTSTCLSFGLLNIRSLNTKGQLIQDLLSDRQIDFLCLSETWKQRRCAQ
ncbi:hypothetical protein WMY93_032564 [Mugilogobius chulae]|uniref:SRCR domain-containing protein n=1 Tax=Mugilogobius chulae TaxID=88201 RepID=A0AAW0MVA6_9GOBI